MYELFDKIDKFPLSVVRMPHFSSNTPSAISFGYMFFEPVRVVICCLRTDDFTPRASDMFSGMIAQGGNRAVLTQQLQKTFRY